MKAKVTFHRGLTGRFGFMAGFAVCGARGVKTLVTNRLVSCPACLTIIRARQAEAKAKVAHLVSP